MYLKTYNEYECCGCGACKSICPKKCIEMLHNDEGFQYPVIVDREKCIHCGLCEKVCVFKKQEKISNTNPTCYYGWHKDEQIRQDSTSGAAFIAIVQVCRDLGYNFFCGAVYDENNRVVHVCTDDFDKILAMRTSKYVQSDLKNVYREIRELLKKGEKVVFSGTPCQGAGLNSYVGEKLGEKLIIISLVCHGVSSPLCFEKYKKSIEKKYSSNIIGIRFRDKKIKDGKLNHKFTTVFMKDGTVIESTENPYTIMFGLGYMHRKSCSQCQYATPLRNNDLTIGDFWGINLVKPELADELSKGISVLLSHSEKGEKICNLLHRYMIIEKLSSYSQAINPYQQQLSKAFEENPYRDCFIQNVVKGDFLYEANKILMIRKVKTVISNQIKKIAKKKRLKTSYENSSTN